MIDNNNKVWLDGELMEAGNANVSILTHSLHYGSSVFEGIRAYQTQEGDTHIFRLREHIERLFYSAEAMYLSIPYSVEEIEEACKEVMRANGFKSAYVRPLVFYDESNMGLSPAKNKTRVAVIAWEWGKYLASEIRVKISPIRRISEFSTDVKAKIGGHYINSIHATLEARDVGYDEALLLDEDGHVAEGPGENIFFVKGDTLYTPSEGKILRGITRDSVIKIARELGYKVKERTISPWEFSAFEAAFMTGTAAEITFIKEISGVDYDVNKGKEIKEKFYEIVEGRTEEFRQWLSFV